MKTETQKTKNIYAETFRQKWTNCNIWIAKIWEKNLLGASNGSKKFLLPRIR